jgi:ABC-type transport system involved in multi-copper enzyme maturation permease subunit
VRGVEDDNGYTIQLPSHDVPYFETAEIGNPLLPLFPSIDMVTFVGIIMSLLAIVFGYDAVCGEKERGTLRLMLSYAVPRDTVLLGKWIGGYATLTIPFLLAVIAGAAVMLVQPDVSLTARQWVQFAVLCGLALLYIAAVFSASMWVSCLTARPSTSIMVLVTLWMILVLAVPNLSPYLAQVWRPTRDLDELETARRNQAEAIWKEQVEAEMKKYDKAHGFGKRWWREIDWDNWESRKRAEERRLHELTLERQALLSQLQMHKQMTETLNVQLDRQILLSRWISRVSPFSCFAMACTELTDTGVHGKRHLLAQIHEHQVRLCEYGFAEWFAYHNYQFEHEGKRPPIWSKVRKKPIPGFAYAAPAGGDYLGLVLADGGILVGMAVVFFMLSYVGFLRYDVR